MPYWLFVLLTVVVVLIKETRVAIFVDRATLLILFYLGPNPSLTSPLLPFPSIASLLRSSLFSTPLLSPSRLPLLSFLSVSSLLPPFSSPPHLLLCSLSHLLLSHLLLSSPPLLRVLHQDIPHPCVPPLGPVLVRHKVCDQPSAPHRVQSPQCLMPRRSSGQVSWGPRW